MRSHESKRATRVLLVTALSATAISAILLSPVALSVVTSIETGADWTTLSEIGQTYGAVSALVAGIALITVAISLWLQSLELRANREQNMRALHVDLLKMALDDPSYMECWGSFIPSDGDQFKRQHVYTNLIVSHWQAAYTIGYLQEPELRLMLTGFFGGSVGREFWRRGRDARLTSSGSKMERRFHQLVDEAYRETTNAKAAHPEGHTAGNGPTPEMASA